MDKEETFGRR